MLAISCSPGIARSNGFTLKFRRGSCFALIARQERLTDYPSYVWFSISVDFFSGATSAGGPS